MNRSQVWALPPRDSFLLFKLKKEKSQPGELSKHHVDQAGTRFHQLVKFSSPSSWVTQLNGDSQAKVQRVLRLISGGGLSMTGSHILCGDFLFSGHTVVLTLTYLFIKECE